MHLCNAGNVHSKLCPMRKQHGRCHRLQALPGLSQLLGRLPGPTTQCLELQDSDPEFRGWQQKGYAVDSQKVVTQQSDGQGRGLVAAAAVRKGDLLMAVPKSLVIFPETAAQESVLAPLLYQEPVQLPDMSLLTLFLAEQRYLLDMSAAAASSAWGPYLRLLPNRPVGTVLDWTAQEVETLLAGSGLLGKAAIIRAAAEALWQDLQPIITTAKQQGVCPTDMFSRADIDWAVGISLSRSVRLDDKAGEVVLAPFADLLNHDPTCDAFLVWDEQKQAVVLRPDRSYKAGEQVMAVDWGSRGLGASIKNQWVAAPGLEHLPFNFMLHEL